MRKFHCLAHGCHTQFDGSQPVHVVVGPILRERRLVCDHAPCLAQVARQQWMVLSNPTLDDLAQIIQLPPPSSRPESLPRFIQRALSRRSHQAKVQPVERQGRHDKRVRLIRR